MKILTPTCSHYGQEKGFTLIELIIVIVILGILVLTATAKYRDLSTVAEKAACINNQAALEQAQRLYYTQRTIDNLEACYAASAADLIPFLTGNAVPVCPGDGVYVLDSDGTVSCTDAGHLR